MRLLVLHDDPTALGHSDRPPAGGVGWLLNSTSAALRERGHEIESLLLGDAVVPLDEPASGRRARPSRSIVPAPRLDRDILKAVRDVGPDVVHAHSLYHAASPSLLRNIASIAPLVMTLHDVTPFCLRRTRLFRGERPCERRLGLACLTSGCFRIGENAGRMRDLAGMAIAGRKIQALNAAAQVIAPSAYMARLAVEHGVDEERLVVLPDFSRYPSESSSRPRALRVLFVGRLTREKGFDLLIDALARLRDVAWHLDVAGEGPFREEAETLLREAGLRDRVTFNGQLSHDQLASLYRRARVVAVPSRMPESFCMVGVEALALGRPVVGFGAGGMTEWLQPGGGRYLAEWGDTADFARLLRVALETDDIVATLPSDRFTLEAHVSRLEAVYASARTSYASRPGRPSLL